MKPLSASVQISDAIRLSLSVLSYHNRLLIVYFEITEGISTSTSLQ